MKADPREEISLSLGEKTYRVRPTFQVIAGIEAATDNSAKTLGLKCLSASLSSAAREERAAGKEISLTEMAVIISMMVQGQPGAPTNAGEVGELLMEYGCGQLYATVGTFLIRSQRGHKEHIREVEEAAERARKAAETGDTAQGEAGQGDGAADPPTEG